MLRIYCMKQIIFNKNVSLKEEDKNKKVTFQREKKRHKVRETGVKGREG